MSYETHDFFCCNCGRLGLPIARPTARKRERGHLKNLYCVHCKQEYNHVEITSDQEKQEFFINFEKGVYKDAKNYIPTVWTGRIG